MRPDAPTRDLRHAAGSFVHGLAAWSWYAHLTFEDAVSEPVADRVFRDWARHTARENAHEHVTVHWGRELQRRGVLHFHVLLALPEGVTLDSRQAERDWKLSHRLAGWTRIVTFDPERGAAWYTTKGGDWDVNIACSRPRRCRRSNGCREAPFGW